MFNWKLLALSIPALVLFVLLAGCGKAKEAPAVKITDLKQGMKYEEVVKLMGSKGKEVTVNAPAAQGADAAQAPKMRTVEWETQSGYTIRCFFQDGMLCGMMNVEPQAEK